MSCRVVDNVIINDHMQRVAHGGQSVHSTVTVAAARHLAEEEDAAANVERERINERNSKSVIDFRVFISLYTLCRSSRPQQHLLLFDCCFLLLTVYFF